MPIKHTRVFIKLPDYWKPHLPAELRKYVGIPLELLKALYGVSFSGLFLYEALAQFLTDFGLGHSLMNGFWFKRLPDNGFFIFLNYSDDCLSCCSDDKEHEKFRVAFARKFPLKCTPNASWFLASRITRDEHGNTSLDQYRYSRTVVQRYLPNAATEPSPEDLVKYIDPLPRTFEWTIKDNSADISKLKELENEYNIRAIEVVGSLNYLSNTSIKMVFAIRKAAKFTRLPGRKHFKALTHMLHHLRCYPPIALNFYHDPFQSPLHRMLQAAGLGNLDPTIIYFSDSAFMDCDDRTSTGCHIVMYRGGCIEHVSGSAGIVADSTAEAEAIWISIAAKSSAHIRQVHCQLMYGDPDRQLTVPLLTDSRAAMLIMTQNRNSRRFRHVERRIMVPHSQQERGHISIHHVAGDDFMLADVGTNNLPSSTSNPKIDVICGEFNATIPPGRKQLTTLLKSKRSDGMTSSTLEDGKTPSTPEDGNTLSTLEARRL